MANRPNRYIKLSEEEDERLRELEQNPYIHKKVRLRAQMLRLSQAGFSIEAIARHVGKSYNLVRATFTRWQQEGYAGLADHYEHHGRKPVITEEIAGFMSEKLAEERTWTCGQLTEVIAERYGVKVGPEGIRKRLKALGYSWKKGRFVPQQRPSEEALKEHKAALETLKRGRARDA
jgi:transposase